MEEARATFYAGLITARLDYQPEIIWPVAHMTKREVLDFLPPEIVEMVSFCRNPVESWGNRFRPCGTCVSCNTRKEAGRFPGPEASYPALARSSSRTVQNFSSARLKSCFFGFVPMIR